MGNQQKEILAESEREPQNRGLTAEDALPRQKRKVKKRTSSNLDLSNEGKHINADVLHKLGGEHDKEPTMAEKLASLDLLDDDKAKNITTQEQYPAATPPSADSVHVLLKQALHADDRALLLDCLYTRDEKVIAKSTSLLNPADVLKLLKSLISMLQSRGAVLVCALPWLRSLLSQHASSIVSQESSLLILNSLYQLAESRNSTFGSAVQLSTCLDYLFVGIPDDEVDEETTVPAVVYEDKDSSDEDESEDAMETDDDDDDENGGLGAVIDSPPRDSEGHPRFIISNFNCGQSRWPHYSRFHPMMFILLLLD